MFQFPRVLGWLLRINNHGAHAADEETEAQREDGVHPVSHSKLVSEVGLEQSVRP